LALLFGAHLRIRRESTMSDDVGSAALDKLALCEIEPVHIPGAIQPHGAVLAALADGLVVTHASANLVTILGRPFEAVLGLPLANAIGEAACLALVNAGPSDEVRAEPVHSLIGPDGGLLFLRAHRTGRHLCVDIERIKFEPLHRRPIFLALSVAETFTQAGAVIELCELAVRGLKAISGYDRVMAYRFDEDGDGEVVAEAREAHLKPYLGQHYPASDIPATARRLYLRQRVGAIADSSYTPVPLCVDPALDDGAPLDLTHSALRSASPVHREYMRNMNTAASLTIGLVHGPDLWGMLVCHHAVPRIAGAELRVAADMIGRVVSLGLGGLGEAEVHAQRIARMAMLRALIDRLAAPVALPEAFVKAAPELLRLVDAGGAVVRVLGELVCIGQTPPAAAIELALSVLQPLADGEVLALDNLGVRHPELIACTSEGSGVLLLPLASGNEDVILWFRPERVRTITWGGNPSVPATWHAATGQISPRTSFAAWEESVRGRSMPWTKADLALARELRAAVEAEMAMRTRRALRESQAELGLLVEHSGDAVMSLAPDGTRRYVSPAIERLLGWRPDELVGSAPVLGSRPAEFVHPEDLQLVLELSTALHAGSVSEIAVCFRHLCRDGSWLWVDGRSRLRMGANGAGPDGIVVTLRDATDRKAVEFKLVAALERMERMAATDGLTGLFNRRHFDGVAKTEWRRCAREQRPLSLLLLDADHFKSYNDRYGHPAGDDCLRAIATQLTVAAQRPADFVARYGGEEFLVLLPHTDRDGAAHVAERLRRLVAGLGLAHEDNPAGAVVTVSVGGATAWPGLKDSGPRSVAELLAAADAALYEAKSGGRNRVVLAKE
jgi:diguanylate cyclase (GGDEF)-like protein/PAS domain S-box-containing protein